MRHLATVLTLGTLVACSPLVRAADLDSSRRPLQVNIMQEPAEFEDPYYCAYVTSGDAKFTFVIPQGFRLKGDTSAGGVFLGNQNGDSTLSFAILTSSAEP